MGGGRPSTEKQKNGAKVLGERDKGLREKKETEKARENEGEG